MRLRKLVKRFRARARWRELASRLEFAMCFLAKEGTRTLDRERLRAVGELFDRYGKHAAHLRRIGQRRGWV